METSPRFGAPDELVGHGALCAALDLERAVIGDVPIGLELAILRDWRLRLTVGDGNAQLCLAAQRAFFNGAVGQGKLTVALGGGAERNGIQCAGGEHITSPQHPAAVAKAAVCRRGHGPDQDPVDGLPGGKILAVQLARLVPGDLIGRGPGCLGQQQGRPGRRPAAGSFVASIFVASETTS